MYNISKLCGCAPRRLSLAINFAFAREKWALKPRLQELPASMLLNNSQKLAHKLLLKQPRDPSPCAAEQNYPSQLPVIVPTPAAALPCWECPAWHVSMTSVIICSSGWRSGHSATVASQLLQNAAAVVEVVSLHSVGLGLPLHELPAEAGAAPRRRVARVVEQILQAPCSAPQSSLASAQTMHRPLQILAC